ncbi:hypothetical protein [Ornithinimicrobium avium]|uniref:Uncharacterized protein n=1 Tax=Ornithinimicrobium avium TaxID=2283195 RepID=A0A345NPJ7_9MICO|nr:hypothetical protein [Ornithinimicrobium avium]AXH96955.1 hypothetical protein DV701_13245 [Ornithinimicrobium avium]
MSVMAHRIGSMWSLLAWLIAGSVITFFGLSLMTVGLPVLAIAIAAAALRNWKWDLPWLLAGATAPLLSVAWRNRGGPGDECIATPSVSGCGELLDPMPWLLFAVVLLAAAAGILAYGRLSRPALQSMG